VTLSNGQPVQLRIPPGSGFRSLRALKGAIRDEGREPLRADQFHVFHSHGAEGRLTDDDARQLGGGALTVRHIGDIGVPPAVLEQWVHDDPGKMYHRQRVTQGVMEQARRHPSPVQNGYSFYDHGDGRGELRYGNPPVGPSMPLRCLNPGESLPSARVDLPDVPLDNVSSSDSSDPPTPHDPPNGVPPEVQEQLVNARMFLLGFRPEDRGARGDCFFQSCAGSLGDPIASHVEKRQQVVQYIRENPDNYSPFIVGDFTAYCNTMGTAGEYIQGDIEIRAAAEVFNANIHIYAQDDAHDRLIRKADPDFHTRNVLLVYYAGMQHYRECQRL
jgi:hypothetical protein